jgi:hypothetical protein
MKFKPNFKFNWKYALGEIVLIFIGISLAMGFDNWSQNKREREQLEGYLETIRKNVVSDTASIAETDSRYKSFHELALNHLNMAIHDEYSEETLLGSLQILAEQYVVIDQSGFEALKSSGFIKDLQGTTLEDALFAYYTSYSKALLEENSLNNFIENMEVELYNSSSKEVTHVLKWTSAKQLGLELEEEAQMNSALKWFFSEPHLLGIIQRYADEDSPRYELMLSNAKELISQIDLELKN